MAVQRQLLANRSHPVNSLKGSQADKLQIMHRLLLPLSTLLEPQLLRLTYIMTSISQLIIIMMKKICTIILQLQQTNCLLELDQQVDPLVCQYPRPKQPLIMDTRKGLLSRRQCTLLPFLLTSLFMKVPHNRPHSPLQQQGMQPES